MMIKLKIFNKTNLKSMNTYNRSKMLLKQKICRNHKQLILRRFTIKITKKIKIKRYKKNMEMIKIMIK